LVAYIKREALELLPINKVTELYGALTSIFFSIFASAEYSRSIDTHDSARSRFRFFYPKEKVDESTPNYDWSMSKAWPLILIP
jgi:hypothetical protein